MQMCSPIPAFSYQSAGNQRHKDISCDIAYIPPAVDSGHFAFARVQGQVFLVQVSSMTPASALTTVDVKIFRHEFITIFRFSESKTLHPSDIQIVEWIDDQLKCYEEEKETVFLAKNLMERLRRLTMPARLSPSRTRRGVY